MSFKMATQRDIERLNESLALFAGAEDSGEDAHEQNQWYNNPTFSKMSATGGPFGHSGVVDLTNRSTNAVLCTET